jgi:hypothetical protein
MSDMTASNKENKVLSKSDEKKLESEEIAMGPTIR